MQAMVATVFAKLRHLDTEDQLTLHAQTSTTSLGNVDASDPSGLRMTAPDPRSAQLHSETTDGPGLSVADERPPALAPPPDELVVSPVEEGEWGKAELCREQKLRLPPPADDMEILPYGLASIQELLRVLVSLLNPHDQQHTDSMRLMALGLLNIAFEVAGQSIGRFATLRAMVGDHLCKHLFQLARSDNMQILLNSLRIICNIFDTMQPHLKLQQELFLSFLLDRLVLPPSNVAPGTRKAEIEAQLDQATWAQSLAEPSSTAAKAVPANLTTSGGRSTPVARERERSERERDGRGSGGAEAKELMLEVLSHFGRGRHAMAEFWTNYDCNVEGEDLFERLVRFLGRVSCDSWAVGL